MCTGQSVPRALRGLQASMIMKMADVLGITDKSSTEAVCVMVDNKIKKTRMMADISQMSINCKKGIEVLKKEKETHTSDVQKSIEKEMDALLTM